MTKKSASSAPATPDHPLSEKLDRTADELQLIREILSESQIDFQWAIQNCFQRTEAKPTNRTPSLGLLPVYNESDAVEVEHNRLQAFGEILSVDDADNSAVVLLIPSNETITVSQDSLSRIVPDALRRICEEPSSCIDPDPVLNSKVEPADIPRGNLF